MIRQTVSNGVCVLHLHAPLLNTISFPLLADLRAAIRRTNLDPQVSGVVITGDSGHFSAGAEHWPTTCSAARFPGTAACPPSRFASWSKGTWAKRRAREFTDTSRAVMLDRLVERCPEQFAPCQLLREMR